MFSVSSDEGSDDDDDEEFFKAALYAESQKSVESRSCTKRKSFTLADGDSSKKFKQTLPSNSCSSDDPLGLNRILQSNIQVVSKISAYKDGEVSVNATSVKDTNCINNEKIILGGESEFEDNVILFSTLEATNKRTNNAPPGLTEAALIPSKTNSSVAISTEVRSTIGCEVNEEIPDSVLVGLDGSFEEPCLDDKVTNNETCRSPYTFKNTSFNERIKDNGGLSTPKKDIVTHSNSFQTASTPLPGKTPPPLPTQNIPETPTTQNYNFKSRITAKLSCFKRDDNGVTHLSSNKVSPPGLSQINSVQTRKESAKCSASDSSVVSDAQEQYCDVSKIKQMRQLPMAKSLQGDGLTQSSGPRNELKNSQKLPKHPGLNNTVPAISETFKSPPAPNSLMRSSSVSNPKTNNRSVSTFSHSSQHLLRNISSVTQIATPDTSILKTPLSSRLSIGSTTSILDGGWDTPAADKGLANTSGSTLQSSNAGPTRNKRKRKFPGPAGVLPKLKSSQSLAEIGHVKPSESPQISAREEARVDIPSSQTTEDRFQEDQWLTMTKELEPRAANILKQFDIASVVKKASKKQLPKGKVPVICVIIDQVNTHTADASVVFRDPSGEMKGTIHRQLVKEYPVELQTGSVLVLRQVGVFSPSPRSHYLNITPKNLVRLYPKGGVTTSVIKINSFVEDDFVIPEPVQVVQQWQSTNPTNSIATSNFNCGVEGQNKILPFSVIGNRTPTPQYRNPTASTSRPAAYRATTPQRPHSNVRLNSSLSTPNRNQTPQSLGRGAMRTSAPVIFASPSMNCSSRTFTPNSGRTLTQNSGRTFTPNTTRTFTPRPTMTKPPATDNQVSLGLKPTSVETPFRTWKQKENSEPVARGSSVNNTATCTTSATAQTPKFHFKNNSGAPVEKLNVSSEPAKTSGKLNFSIQEDVDELLQGLGDEIFGDM